jgi:hypothetical protein
MTPARTLLIGAFAVALAMLLCLPLQWLAARVLPTALPAVSALEATGTLWSGRLRGTRWNDIALGDVAVRLKPLQLLRGRVSLHVANAQVSAALVRGLRQGIAHAEGRIALPLNATDARATLEAGDLQLLFDGARCDSAGGTLSLQVTRTGVDKAEVALAQLSGTPRCEGNSARVALSAPADAPPGLRDGLLDVLPSGRYRLILHAEANAAGLGAALQLAGFTPAADGRLERSIEGSLLR